MDSIGSLTNALSQVTMYDIKSMYNQAKNMVLNVSEMEGKVQEATNDDAWGASSTLMQEIAQGTFNFQQFNEIMPAIYTRFMEKEARQWREIYKALQLLEYLIKNGSERVVDDARSHLGTVKMLRSFHFIDDKGKDQGINVRNRAKEIVELLGDVDKIRTERRKAKANRSKYTGVGNDGSSFSGGGGGGGGRYGGFGSESAGGGDHYSGSGGYSSRSSDPYGSSSYDRDTGGASYSGGGGSSSSGFRDSSGRGEAFDEYDAGDDDVVAARRQPPAKRSTIPADPPPPPRRAPAQPAPKQPEVNLLDDLDDDSWGAPVPAPAPVAGANKALPSVSLDDDFGDFAAAPAASAPAPAAAPAKGANVFDMLGSAAPAPQARAPAMGMGMGGLGGMASPPPMTSYGNPMAAAPMMGGMASPPPMTSYGNPMGAAPMMGGMASPPPMAGFGAPMAPTSRAQPAAAAAKPAPAKSAGGGFEDLWTMSLGGAGSGGSKPATPAPGAGKSMQEIQREKAQAALFGGGMQAKPAQPPSAAFGAFGTAPPPSAGGGDDDLLL